MKVPPKRKGNVALLAGAGVLPVASMKVPPKRKGNRNGCLCSAERTERLNESPSQKEGKSNQVESLNSVTGMPQ